MFRLLLPLLLSFPALADPAPVVEYLGPDPYWRWESFPCQSHYTAQNTIAGPQLHFTIDPRGPSWLYISAESIPHGRVVVSVTQTCTGYRISAGYRSWDDLLAGKDDAALWFRAAMVRCGIAVE